MKKIAIAMVAVATLGLAACNSAGTEANNTTDLNLTENGAAVDVDNATDAANSSLDGNLASDAGNMASDAGNAIENGAEAVGNAVENTVDGQ
jgi:hypothetical protein